MTHYEDYNPTLHRNLPLFEIKDGPPDANGAIPMILRKVTDPGELETAKSVPYFYVVQIEDQPEPA
jgi:hypothetical protein